MDPVGMYNARCLEQACAGRIVTSADAEYTNMDDMILDITDSADSYANRNPGTEEKATLLANNAVAELNALPKPRTGDVLNIDARFREKLYSLASKSGGGKRRSKSKRTKSKRAKSKSRRSKSKSKRHT